MIINPYNNFIGKLKIYLEKKHPIFLEEYLLPLSMVLLDRLLYFNCRKQSKSYIAKQNFLFFKQLKSKQ